MATETCGCDEAQQLRAQLAELQEAAYPVLAWVDRDGGGRQSVQRLERALAGFEPKATPSRCSAAAGRHGITCELPAGHAGEHRCCQIRWAQ